MTDPRAFQFQTPQPIVDSAAIKSTLPPPLHSSSSSSFGGFKGNSTFEQDFVMLCKLVDSPKDWLKIESVTRSTRERQDLILEMISGTKSGNLSNLMQKFASFLAQAQVHSRDFDQLRMRAAHVVIDNDNTSTATVTHDVMES